MNTDTIQMSLFDYFMEDEQFTIPEATALVKEQKKLQVNDESIRARIYEGLELGIFKRVARGVYKVESQLNKKTATCLLINGDGRDLSFIEDNSIDGIITDHPYDLAKSLTGGNRKFATYELFKYTQKDFQEKMRVLKEGAFCVEFLPEENEVNYQYLYEIKQMAIKEGFKYFTKVPWIKGDFKANTGRKSKNREDIMFFSKGEPRTLKLDAKKNIQLAKENDIDVKGLSSYEVKERLEENGLSVFYMKGTSGMLPTEFQSEVENFPKEFDFQPRSRTQKVMEAEKPVALMESIIEYISLPDELLLDQFGGSGNFGIACLNTNRNAIIVEKDEQTFERMKDNIVNTMKDKSEASISIKEVDLDEDMDMEMELM